MKIFAILDYVIDYAEISLKYCPIDSKSSLVLVQ